MSSIRRRSRAASPAPLRSSPTLRPKQGNVDLIDAAEEAFGPIDLFFANAGVAIGTDLTMSEDE